VAEVRIRRSGPEDMEAVYRLFAAWQESVFGEAEMGPEMFASALATGDAAFVAEAEGGIVGQSGVRGGGIDVLVEPTLRRQGIGTALLAEAEQAATAEPLLLVGVALEPSAAPFALASGYSKDWEVWLMGIDLPATPPTPEWPEGVGMRTFREDDARAVKELLDLAYAQEFHHRPLPFEHWRRFMLEDPSYDPDVWFLAVVGNEIVGAALNWKEGYVKDLVVHPDWRGRGLGRALMQHTFAEFARRGIPRVTLKTDSNNPTGAWRLYERLGMKVERTYEVFTKRP
jgi:mycothiol synthase